MKKLFTFMALLSLSLGAWAEEETTTNEKDTTYIVDVWNGSVEEEKVSAGSITSTDGKTTYKQSWWNDESFSSGYKIPAGSTLTLNFKNYCSEDSAYYPSKATDWYIYATSLFVTNNINVGSGQGEYLRATLDGRVATGTTKAASGYPNDTASLVAALDSASVEIKVTYIDPTIIATITITSKDSSVVMSKNITGTYEDADTLRAFLTVDACYIDSINSSLNNEIEDVWSSFNIKYIPYVDGYLVSSTLGNSDLTTSWWTCSEDYIIPRGYELSMSFTNYCDTSEAGIAYNTFDKLTAVMVVSARQDNRYDNEEQYYSEYIGLTNTGWQWCTKGSKYAADSTDYNYLHRIESSTLAKVLNGSKTTIRISNGEDSLEVWMTVVNGDSTLNQYVKCEINSDTANVYAILAIDESYLTDIESSMKYTRANSDQGAYGTVCMPFDATVDNAKAYEVVGYGTDANGNPETLYLDSVSTCEAGKGYVFLTTSTDSIVFNVTGTTMVDEPSEGALVGTFADTLAVDSCDYILTSSTSDNTTSYVWGKGKGNYIKRYRAYLDSTYVFDTNNFAPITSNTANAKGYIMFSIITDSDDNTTGIQEIVSDEQNGEADDIIYNLSGIRVTNPQKGIYIKNGKKYIIK